MSDCLQKLAFQYEQLFWRLTQRLAGKKNGAWLTITMCIEAIGSGRPYYFSFALTSEGAGSIASRYAMAEKSSPVRRNPCVRERPAHRNKAFSLLAGPEDEP